MAACGAWIVSERLRNQMEAFPRTGGNGNGGNGGWSCQDVGRRPTAAAKPRQNAATQEAARSAPVTVVINGWPTTANYGGGRYGYGDIGGYSSPTGTERQQTPVTQAEIQRAYQNAIQELNDLQRSVQGQPEPLADISELLKEMQQLDPKRFLGNPAMLEELHGRVLGHRGSAGVEAASRGG